MKRRPFLLAAGTAAGVAALGALAQPARKPARVGVLSSTTPEARATFWEAFKDAMAKLGWVEGAELADNLRRAAGYVDRILKGAKPADLPVEQPRSFELVVNLKAAREQGIRIPQPLLIRATRIIE